MSWGDGGTSGATAGTSGPGRLVGSRLRRGYDRGMSVLRSRLDPASAESLANRAAMDGLVADLRERQARVSANGAGGDPAAIEKHRARGKLPVRERIDRLIDPGSAFLELSPLAADGVYGDDGHDAPSAGIVTGIGQVEGRHLRRSSPTTRRSRAAPTTR